MALKKVDDFEENALLRPEEGDWTLAEHSAKTTIFFYVPLIAWLITKVLAIKKKNT